ncbi:PREDICTED: uncharacterized protein LOC105565867 [Vollenhovia emeryi]|uniref:uncharacterized protein LOC105565867 n=1 Tax=Vollenhovia emeryi TaxID=411798 RepID=UPI0005F56B41|nr:PREDICTED: uncharacterized protein LOC105565867 [Vollenhovia emeryi]
MAALLKLQSFVIIIVCFHPRSSHGFTLPYDGVKIVTYGEPCHLPRYLPVTIEEPAEPVTELVLPDKPCAYRPLKLNYRVIATEPIPEQPYAEYPVAVEVPQAPQPTQLLEIITPDPLRGKSYAYNVQTPLSPPAEPISRTYDIDFQIPSLPISQEVPTPQSVKLLTGLTSKIDKVLIPACQNQGPSSSCCNTDTARNYYFQ